jgi:phytoene desaturase (3,4-didehydrolycopene-forming)
MSVTKDAKQSNQRFDQGPSLVLMPELFRQAFESLGTSLEGEGIEMLKCEPNYCIWFADRDFIELSRDMPHLKAQIEHHEGPGGFQRFCAFQVEAGLQYQLAMESVFRQSFPTLWSMFHPSLLKALFHLRPWTSIYKQASRFFHSEKMRRVWSFTSMYLGMSPYRAPGTYTLLPYIEISDGIWYPKGGFQQVRWLVHHSLFYVVDLNKGFAGSRRSGPLRGSEISPRHHGEED